MPVDRNGHRSWRPAALLPAIVGLLAACYLTVEHFTAPTALACPDSGTVNCTKVTTSGYSHLGPVPVAVAGAVYFALMIALLVPPAWRVRALDPVRVGGALAGVVSVIYLLWAELFRIDAICLWCTAVHVCTVAMFAGILWHTAGAPRDVNAGRH
jgi:uncharacterized membrane protein